MKHTCKAAAAALAAVISLTSLAACGKKQPQYDRYNYDLTEYVKLPEYKGITVTDIDLSSVQADVESQILLARSNYAEAVETDGPAALTDQVNIDFVGTMDGQTFEGGSAEDVDLTLGSGSFIAGFEEGLVGAKKGDTVTLDLAFPDPYTVNPAYSGKAVRFEVTVRHIYQQKLPDYTDEFVKKYYNYDTTAAFEQALKESIEAQNESNRQYYKMAQVWQKLQEGTELIKYPETEYNTLYQNYIAYYTSEAKKLSMSLNEYAAQQMEMSVKEFEDWVSSEVRAYLLEEMILYSIARAENITVSEEEYQSGALAYAQTNGLSSVEELETYFDPADIRQNLLFDKTLEYVVSQAVVSD